MGVWFMERFLRFDVEWGRVLLAAMEHFEDSLFLLVSGKLKYWLNVYCVGNHLGDYT